MEGDPTPTLKLPDQQMLLKQIASMIPTNVSLVSELSYILGISTDSAYRRIRGETELSFSEIVTLCQHYKISFDSIIASNVKVVSFMYNEYNESLESFENYFVGLGEEMDLIRTASVDHRHITFIGPGMPVWHFLNSSTLGAFKMFYWIKSMNLPDNAYKKFDAEELDEGLIQAGKDIFLSYMQIPSTEIWTDSSVQGTLNQIRFCWDTGIFTSKEAALTVCQELHTLLDSIEQQAAAGYKFLPGEGEVKKGEAFRLFYSELEDENMCIHVELGDMHAIYHGHWNHRFLKTTNQQYGETSKRWYQNLEKKSTQISITSESVRYRFFKRGHDKLSELEEHIQKS